MKESSLLDASAAEHHELLRALVAGDGSGAHELMVRHIRHATGWWAGRGEDEPAGDAGASRVAHDA